MTTESLMSIESQTGKYSSFRGSNPPTLEIVTNVLLPRNNIHILTCKICLVLLLL